MLKKEHSLLWAVLLAAALIGMALVVYATTFGPGVGGDATIYLTSARNFIAGKGLGWTEADGSFRLLPYTPPFYPLALSGVGLLVKDMISGARWLNVLLFGVTVLLLGWFFYRATRRLWLAGLLAGVLATSPVLVGVQVWAMSEPLFLLLGFAGLLALLAYLDHPRLGLLLGAALLCGLAFLTRYIGVAYVITAGLALLLLGAGEDQRLRLRLEKTRIRAALLFGAVAILPTLIWLVVDIALTGTVGSRSGQPASAYWQRFLEIGPALQKIYLFWLLPDSLIARLPGMVQTALWLIPLLLVMGLAVWLAHGWTCVAPAAVASQASAAAMRLVQLFALFACIYLMVLAVVQVFTFPPITLASRMLSPVHLAVIVLLFGMLNLALGLLPSILPRFSRLVLAAAYLACLGLLGTYLLRSALIVRDYHRTGIGYLAQTWRDSRTLEMVRQLSASTPIISNETTAIMFLTGRAAYPLQEIYQDQPQTAFTSYGSGEDPAQQIFREKGGALVLFRGTLNDDFAMYGERTGERLQMLTRGLFQYYNGEDGAIYFFNRPLLHSSDCY